MGYKSNIRIITSKEGFEKLKEFVKQYLKDNNEEYNLLEKCDINQEGKEQCYFGWDYVKWHKNEYTYVDAIMKGLNHLGEKEYSYRYMRMGENYDDIEERFCDGEKDNKLFLEYPSMIHEFDDEYLVGLLKEKQIQELEENKEEIDI